MMHSKGKGICSQNDRTYMLRVDARHYGWFGKLKSHGLVPSIPCSFFVEILKVVELG